MRYASWLIQNTDRSMTDIAIETGFADCAHFSRQFKDAYGISPSTHRLQPNRVANIGRRTLASVRLSSPAWVTLAERETAATCRAPRDFPRRNIAEQHTSFADGYIT